MNFSIHSLTLAIVLLAQSALASESLVERSAASTERCSVVYLADSGASTSVVLASLLVIPQTSTDQPFKLPADAPANVQAVTCGRSASLLPAKNDYKVVVAGYLLSIVAPHGGRVGLLELVNGRLQFRMLSGEMTESETSELQVILNDSQTAMDSKTSSSGKL